MMKFKQQSGFAMLFTVLIMSLILSIALSISNITFKQTLLSSLAKDSQIAFYQADAGIECALYYDIVQNSFPLGSEISTVPPNITCGYKELELDTINSYRDYFTYKDSTGGSEPCFSIVFDKSTNPVETILQARGNNTCTQTPRQVERALEAKY